MKLCKALLRLITALLRYLSYPPACTNSSIKALLRLDDGSMTALLRLYYGSITLLVLSPLSDAIAYIKALLRPIQALLRLYFGSSTAL